MPISTESGLARRLKDGDTPFVSIDVNGGAIDGTPIGANSASTGAFSTVSSSGLSTLNSLTVSTTSTLTGAVTCSSTLAVSGTLTASGDVNLNQTSGTVKVGADGTHQGRIQLYGSSTTSGAQIDFYNAASEDTEIGRFIMAADGDWIVRTFGGTTGTVDSIKIVKETGSVALGGTYVKLPVKGTTGDPSSPADGWMYVNTSDNKVRVYADSAWRDLATW